MDISERRNRKSKLRRNELIVWLIILLILVLFGCFLYHRHENSFTYHNIYMPDVDGLIVGSPVHIMGISVGYVTKTKIINGNEVLVRFKITDKSVKIPKATVATVEFNGLGGSKSLELYPPDSGKEPNEIVSVGEYILVDRPKRLRDSMALLYQMYKTLMNIIYTTTIFGKEVSNTDLPDMTNSETDFAEFIKYADKYIDSAQANFNKTRSIMYKYTNGKYFQP